MSTIFERLQSQKIQVPRLISDAREKNLNRRFGAGTVRGAAREPASTEGRTLSRRDLLPRFFGPIREKLLGIR